MARLSAFVGHSFAEEDKILVRQYLDYLDTLKKLPIGFEWDHAEAAEPTVLSKKIPEKMKGKNVFIGICTRREQVVDPKPLKYFPFIGSYASGESLNWKTSDWILQEIGYALGKDLHLILLLENGLRLPGGLQGDLEHIPFDRQYPEKAFPMIVDMLQAIIPRDILPEQANAVVVPQKGEAAERVPEEPTELLDPQPGWTTKDYKRALFNAIRQNDVVKEENIYRAFLAAETGGVEHHHETWQATRLYYQYMLQGKQVLAELKALCRSYPKNPRLHQFLGAIYSGLDQKTAAAASFRLAADAESNSSEKIRHLCSAARNLADKGDVDDGHKILDEARILLRGPEDELLILGVLIKLAEAEKNNFEAAVLSEGLVDREPDNHNYRFDLGYRYLGLLNDLALEHFLICTQIKDDPGVWNNIGYARDSLKLKSRAVEAYRRSQALGSGKAISNLAFLLIDAGFLDETRKLCDDAMKSSDFDPRIGDAIGRIGEASEKEAALEEQMFKTSKPRRNYFSDYATACTRIPQLPVNTLWNSPHGPLALTRKGDRIEGHASYEKTPPESIYAGLLGPFTARQASPPPEKWKVSISGRITGCGIRFYRNEGKEESTLLTSSHSTGLMILNESSKEIRVYERKDDGAESYYALQLMDDDPAKNLLGMN